METRPRGKILGEIIEKTRTTPGGWRCAIARDEGRFSNEYYMIHPIHGVYAIKEYQKNPLVTKGVGMIMARKVDHEIYESLGDARDEFGILSENPYRVMESVKRGVSLPDILDAGLRGGDLGIRLHARGPVTSAENPLKEIFSKEREALNKGIDRMLREEEMGKSYG